MRRMGVAQRLGSARGSWILAADVSVIVFVSAGTKPPRPQRRATLLQDDGPESRNVFSPPRIAKTRRRDGEKRRRSVAKNQGRVKDVLRCGLVLVARRPAVFVPGSPTQRFVTSQLLNGQSPLIGRFFLTGVLSALRHWAACAPCAFCGEPFRFNAVCQTACCQVDGKKLLAFGPIAWAFLLTHHQIRPPESHRIGHAPCHTPL